MEEGSPPGHGWLSPEPQSSNVDQRWRQGGAGEPAVDLRVEVLVKMGGVKQTPPSSGRVRWWSPVDGSGVTGPRSQPHLSLSLTCLPPQRCFVAEMSWEQQEQQEQQRCSAARADVAGDGCEAQLYEMLSVSLLLQTSSITRLHASHAATERNRQQTQTPATRGDKDTLHSYQTSKRSVDNRQATFSNTPHLRLCSLSSCPSVVPL